MSPVYTHCVDCSSKLHLKCLEKTHKVSFELGKNICRPRVWSLVLNFEKQLT